MRKAFPLSMLVRYGYAGLLATVLAAMVAPQWVHEMTDVLGKVATPFVILAIGGAIYVLYRNIIGEYILFEFVDFIQKKESNPTNFFVELGVEKKNRRSAYTETRREFLPFVQRERLDYDHTELHILYLTAVECFVATFLSGQRVVLASIGFLALLAAIAADIRQHRTERRRLSVVNRDELLTFLAERGYVKKSS